MPRTRIDASTKLPLDDSHILLRRAVEHSGSCLRLSSFNGSSDQRPMLKKSRTIPSNSRNDAAVPVFPGPLLPTVRRLNDSYLPSKEASFTPENLVAEECKREVTNREAIVDAERELSGEAVVRRENAGNYQGRLKNHADLLTCNDKSNPFVGGPVLEATSIDHNKLSISSSLDSRAPVGSNGYERKTERAKLAASRWSPCRTLQVQATGTTEPCSRNTVKAHSESPPNSRVAWKQRSRTEIDGSDQLQIRPTKSLKIGGESYMREVAVESIAKAQPQMQQTKTQKTVGNSNLRTGTGTAVNQEFSRESSERLHATKNFQVAAGANSPAQASHLSKVYEREAHSISHDSGQPNLRRQKIPGSPLEGLDGGHTSEVWINDTVRPTASKDFSSGNSSTSSPSQLPTKWKSLLQWSFAAQNRSFCLVFAFITLLIVCISCLLYRVMFLEKEIAKFQGRLEGCSGVDYSKTATKTYPELQPRETELGIRPQMLSVLFVSSFLLLVPFVLNKYADKLPQLSKKKSNKSTEEEAPLSKRIAYRVDVLFSTHPYMKPVALLLATMVLICAGGIALFAVSSDNLSDALWRSWTYVADSGNHADSVGTGPRIVSVCISFGGMLIFALMLGLVSDAISEKVDSLRKGKSEVIESGHTLILGWSDKLGSLLKQLAIANQSLGGGVVVVLAERDKEEMELDIAKLEFDFMGTVVICRSGSPLIMADLKKVSVSKARAIIVLAEVQNADQSDARALRVVLSLTGVKEGLKGHIVVEMSDLDNEDLVKLVGGELVETVVAHDVIGRLMIQCARQPGLAQIWEDILGFDKSEFYIKRWPQLDGMRFEDVLVSFPDAIPCGVKVFAKGGRIILNPDDDYILCEGDEILVIAEDDDTYTPAALPQVREAPLSQTKRSQKKPQKILLCGWRRDIEDMIKVLDDFLAPGSELWIFSDVQEGERGKKLNDGGLNPESLENIKLVHREGNTVIRRHLESLPLELFDSILILADEKLEDTVVHADSSSLATLLLIRDIQSKRLPFKAPRVAHVRQPGYSQSSWIHEMQQASDKTIIISEILDSRTKNLVTVSKISDYVLSNELVSMALAMVAEDKQINRVLEELFAEEGNELYIRPAEFYLYDQEELTFFEIMIRARQREEIVIGYRRASAEQAVINPPDKGVLQKWYLGDVFVVLAMEE